jgi:hypothetical protein
LVGLGTVQAEDNWLDSFKDLSDKTTSQLRLLKHEIYARHGYVFIDAGLKEYFKTKSWYKPSSGYRNENFNEVEKKIFKEIFKYEREAFKKEILKNKHKPENKSILEENAYWSIERPVYSWGNPEHVGWYNSISAQDYEHVTVWSYSSETNKVHFYAKDNTPGWILNSTLHDKLPSVAGWFSRATDRAGRTQSAFCDLVKGGVYYTDQLGCIKPNIEKISSLAGNYRYTSLGIDAYDQPHISFYDVAKGDLMYVVLSGKPWEMKEWKIKTLDSVGDVGTFNSLKVDNSGRVHVVYYDATELKIKYALLYSDTVEIEDITKQVNTGTVISLALDQNGVPNVSYYGSSGKGLWFASRSGGMWRNYAVDQSTRSGYYSSIAMSGNGAVHIAYYDGSCKCLKFAFRDKEKWLIETVDAEGDVGEYADLTLDSSEQPHIAYYDEASQNLKYAVLLSSAVEQKLASRKKEVIAGSGISIMVPFDDITPPKTHMDFAGQTYTPEENGVSYISKDTYVSFGVNDERECGDISGVLATYYAIDTKISDCVEKDYLAALSNKEYIKKVEAAGLEGQEISSSSYCGIVKAPFVLPEGSHTLSYLSSDHAGNYELENTTYLYVDGTAPQTTLTADDGYFKKDVYWVKSGNGIEMTAEDPASNSVSSGVGKKYYLVDEEPVSDDIEGLGAGFNIYEAPFTLNSGDHTVYFMAMDNVGNAEAVQSIKVHVY